MPDEIKQNPEALKPPTAEQAAAGKNSSTGNNAADKPAAEPLPEPTLADDLALLEKLNLMRAVMLQLQGGRHPDKQIDGLLKRRFDFKTEDFQGPYAIRLICTLMMVFLICMIMWGLIWLLATAFELSAFSRLMSIGIATLMAAAAGVAIFFPASLPDEKLVKEVVTRRMAELKDQGASFARGTKPSEPLPTGEASSDTESATIADEGSDGDAGDEKPLDAVAPDKIA
ncbi:MAG TPA: hypothetical protein PLM07_01280 [Candidatus Rifleibacterium sp.]|nr:hypothetical protein [Candidatus Rifleibacterium sp.]HPT44510.1 hypothetical protein [Candidatus Rifleibacterium sp.]